MANTFKLVTRDVAPASAGTPETIYTVQTGSTIVMLGLTLANVHTSQVTAELELVSTTTNRGGNNNVDNGTAFLAKDIPIPVGSSVELLAGNKVVLEAGDKLRVDCSVADKLSGALSIMEIT